MKTDEFNVPLINILTGERRIFKAQATTTTDAIQSAQELNPGWSAAFPVRRYDQWGDE